MEIFRPVKVNAIVSVHPFPEPKKAGKRMPIPNSIEVYESEFPLLTQNKFESLCRMIFEKSGIDAFEKSLEKSNRKIKRMIESMKTKRKGKKAGKRY